MALSSDDWARLDGKFSEVTARINNVVDRMEDRMNIHSTKINAVSVEAIRSVSAHEKDHHDPRKKWTLYGTLVAIATALGSAVNWFFGKGDK